MVLERESQRDKRVRGQRWRRRVWTRDERGAELFYHVTRVSVQARPSQEEWTVTSHVRFISDAISGSK